jgi:alkylation response protein AidB-like acyl-CoA dehydrogenase
MDFRFTAEQEAFRQDIRTFVREVMPEPPDIPEDAWIVGFDRMFSKKLAARGWIGLTWPREYGGQGKSYLDRLILTEELLRHGAPVAAHWLGDRQMGPSILRYGTPEQKRKFLRDCSRATGFSQPVHDAVMPGFVAGLRRGLHATYPAPDAHRSALVSAPGRHSFASCDSAGYPAPPHSR